VTTRLDEFVAQAPPIDSVREEAARCAEETGRWQRGERGPLRMPGRDLLPEFSDTAFGVAAEVAMIVGDAMKRAGTRFDVAFPWTMAATLLRSGWQRGHKLVGHVVDEENAS
jgi:hypothetical protein